MPRGWRRPRPRPGRRARPRFLAGGTGTTFPTWITTVVACAIHWRVPQAATSTTAQSAPSHAVPSIGKCGEYVQVGSPRPWPGDLGQVVEGTHPTRVVGDLGSEDALEGVSTDALARASQQSIWVLGHVGLLVGPGRTAERCLGLAIVALPAQGICAAQRACRPLDRRNLPLRCLFWNREPRPDCGEIHDQLGPGQQQQNGDRDGKQNGTRDTTAGAVRQPLRHRLQGSRQRPLPSRVGRRSDRAA